jgi:Integrase zinc binding domain
MLFLMGKLFKKTVLNNGLFFAGCVCQWLGGGMCHDGDNAGHLGKTRIRERVLARFTWPGVYDEVDNYVRTCPQCQTRKHQVPRVRAPQQHVEVTGPFETIGIDVLGPSIKTRKQILLLVLAVDYLTKWTMTCNRSVHDQRSNQVLLRRNLIYRLAKR